MFAEKTVQTGELGRDKAEPSAVYSKAGMWCVLVLCCGLAIAGLVLCIVSAARQNVGAIVVGSLMILIGNYVLIAAVKEKAILDLFADHFKSLSSETQDELSRKWLQNFLDSSGGVLRLIETILNSVLNIFRKADS